MKPEVVAALARAAEARRGVLSNLTHQSRKRLLEDLFLDFFIHQWQTLVKWAALTGQSAQVDTGYIAQHTASIVLGEPGQGFRGKGKDLLDGTEVKSAAIVSGVDRPRWNHNLGRQDQDQARIAKGLAPTWQAYLSAPYAFYLLFDRVVDGASRIIGTPRVRAWCVDAQADEAWRSLLHKYVQSRAGGTYNFQLHPPVGYDDSIVVNTLGNLDMADVLMLDARLHELTSIDESFWVEWRIAPPDEPKPIQGRCTAIPYGGRSSRPSRLNAAIDVLPDINFIAQLLPEVDLSSAINALKVEIAIADEDYEETGEV